MLSLLRKNFVDPAQCLWSGSPRRRHWRLLEKSQYLPRSLLLEIQFEKLRETLEHAYRRNRFYRRRFESSGLTPDLIQDYSDLRALPILTKAEVRIHTEEMISDGFTRRDLMRSKTGGSTGVALELFFTEECSEIRNACAIRHDRWAGWEIGQPRGAVWGNPPVPSNLRQRVRSWLLHPTIFLDTMKVNEGSVRRFAEEWVRVKPMLLFGHAHSLYLLADYVRRMSISSIQPKGIISTSMTLSKLERRAIEEVFLVKVFDRYGCEELGLIASECSRHEGMHLNTDHLYIEFCREDGSPCTPGEPGKIVVTDLVNRAMPFIRYEVGDVGTPSEAPCPCGRGLPLMKELVGRTADFLIKPDGTRVAGVSLIENTLTRIPGIFQMQIIQESLATIVLRIVPDHLFDRSGEEELLRYFRSLFGSAVSVEIEYVPRIKPEKSGKYRFSICRVNQTDAKTIN